MRKENHTYSNILSIEGRGATFTHNPELVEFGKMNVY